MQFIQQSKRKRDFYRVNKLCFYIFLILLTVLDASSKYSGLMYGSRFDWGNFDQCLEIDYYYKNGRLMGKYCPFAMMIPDIETGYSDWDVSYSNDYNNFL